MLPTSILLTTAFFLGLSSATPDSQQWQPASTSSTSNVTRASYDGQCFYPVPDRNFKLAPYLGRWYQIAGTVAPFTSGCTCVYAQYSLNANGTVNVFNGCQLGNRNITIQGLAAPVPESAGYGKGGVLKVSFGAQTTTPDTCPGPNYIVQGMRSSISVTKHKLTPADIKQNEDDQNSFAIVQASNFTTLFLLSRRQNPPESEVQEWLQRAGRQGTDLSKVVRTNQTGCLFT